jgi:hypothetical protein
LIVFEWIARGLVIAFGCWWVYLAAAVSALDLRERPQGYVREVAGVLAAKGLPGVLVIASALTLNHTLAVLAAGIAVGMWVAGSVFERLGIQIGIDVDPDD